MLKTFNIIRSVLDLQANQHSLSRQISILAVLIKGQFNSEWIYDVIVSFIIFQDFCPGSLLLQGFNTKTESMFLFQEIRLSFVVNSKLPWHYFVNIGNLSFINQFSKKLHLLASTASDRKGAKFPCDILWYFYLFQNIKVKLNSRSWMTLKSSVVIFRP